jgi:hypothetical protein
MVESEKLRGRETVLGFHAERYVMRMLTNYQVRHWSRTKDGEPYALKGARTVRGGGHAIPARVNGPYSTSSSSSVPARPLARAPEDEADVARD